MELSGNVLHCVVHLLKKANQTYLVPCPEELYQLGQGDTWKELSTQYQENPQAPVLYRTNRDAEGNKMISGSKQESQSQKQHMSLIQDSIP